MSTTIREVAIAAKVSQTAVSLAFRPGSRISDATRERVLRVASKLRYVPNLSARHLRDGNPRLLGALVNDLTNPFYAGMVRAMELAAQRASYQMIVMESQWQTDREVDCLNRMAQSRVRGVLLCFSEESGEGQEVLERFRVPYILIDTYPLGYKGSYVANDLTAAGRLAGEHLADVGCRNPVLVVPRRRRRQFSSFVRLRRGLDQALKKRGVAFDRNCVFAAGLTIEEGRRVLPEVMKARPQTDGIFCGNDLCALGAMEAIDKMNMQVGRDVAVIGIDNLPVSRLDRISLTTIEQPHDTIAVEAAQALIEGVERDKPLAVRKEFEPSLIVRASTKR